MISPFNFRGYRALDPLDFVSPGLRMALGGVVTAAMSVLLVYTITVVYPVVTFIGGWFMVFEVVGYAIAGATLLLWLRKSSSVVLYAAVTLPLTLTDVYLQAQFRDHGIPALWDYPGGTVVSLMTILPLRFLLTISVDGIIIGPLSLWITRLVASLFYDRKAAAGVPTPAQRAALFADEWSLENVEPPKRDAGYWMLRLLGFGYLSYLLLLVLGALGTSPWPPGIRFLLDMTYVNPLFAVSTYCKITFMVILAFMGAYNDRMRWHATLALAIGHGVSIASSLFFYLLDSPGDPYRDFLLTSAIVDGAMVLLFVWIIVRSAARRYPFTRRGNSPRSSPFRLPSPGARTLSSRCCRSPS